MFGLITAAGLVLAGSALCGTAVRRLSGLQAPGAAAPAVGFALLLALAGTTIRLPGRATTSAVVVVCVILASAAFLASRRGMTVSRWDLVTAGAVLALALLPFLAGGRIGLLGAGTNDDTAQHLLAAWTLQGPSPLGANKLIASGYPIGPHALAATIAQISGMSLERSFTVVIIVVPVLLALAAAALLPSRPVVLRGAIAAAVGLCYLQAGFLVQGSFKEPMEAVMLIAFVAGCDELAGERSRGSRSRLGSIPLGVLAAGSVYFYSYGGLLWLIATLIVWALAWLALRRPGTRELRDRARALAAPCGVALGAFLVLVAPEVSRVVSFTHSPYNQEAASVYGDLLHRLSPLEALGVWPRLDFRFDIPLLSAGGILALVALAALVVVVVRCVRRGDVLLPAALGAGLIVYASSLGRSPYTSAKSLVVLAPLVTLLLGREFALLFARGVPSPRSLAAVAAAALGLVFAVGAYSDLELLRDGPVSPANHAEQLAVFRGLIGNRPTLFLGADDFIHWELRGANLATPPAPLYTTVVVPLRRQKAQPAAGDAASAQLTTSRFAGTGLAFDFDSVPADVLDRFDYVILPRSVYSSAAPPNWHVVRTTRSYALWRRTGPTPVRQTLREFDNAGLTLDCRTPAGRQVAQLPGTAMVRPRPIVGERPWWRGAVGYAGRSAHQYLFVPRGTWDVSLQYAAARGVTVHAPGLRGVLPPSLEPLGPYWYAGRMHVRRAGFTRISVTFAALPTLGSLLGATGLTRAPTPTGLKPLGRVVLTRPQRTDKPVPLRQACGRFVDWYRSP